MIEMIATILIIIGTLIATSSIFINSDFKRAGTLFIIGAVILFMGCGLGISISQCVTECKNNGLIYDSQEYNQCTEELTCYCKQPITQPKPRVVIIE